MLCCLQYHSTIYYRNVKRVSLTFFRLFVRRTGWGIEPHTCRHWVGLGLSNPATFSPIASDSLYLSSILSVSHPARPLPEHFHYILYRLFVKGNFNIFSKFFILYFLPIGVDLGAKKCGPFFRFCQALFGFFAGKEKPPEGGVLPTTRKVGGFRVTPRTYSVRTTCASRCPLGR